MILYNYEQISETFKELYFKKIGTKGYKVKIFYIDIEEFKNSHDDKFLNQYADRAYKSKKRFLEHVAGRYLIKSVAEKYYGVNDEIVVDKMGKPFFKNEKLNFSISHSKNIVVACFDECNCGIDIEFMKDRDLSKFSKHYGEKFDSKEDFYKFWTLKEALFKLNNEVKGKCSLKFAKNYFLTVVSDKENIADVEICKLG